MWFESLQTRFSLGAVQDYIRGSGVYMSGIFGDTYSGFLGKKVGSYLYALSPITCKPNEKDLTRANMVLLEYTVGKLSKHAVESKPADDTLTFASRNGKRFIWKCYTHVLDACQKVVDSEMGVSLHSEEVFQRFIKDGTSSMHVSLRKASNNDGELWSSPLKKKRSAVTDAVSGVASIHPVVAGVVADNNRVIVATDSTTPGSNACIDASVAAVATTSGVDNSRGATGVEVSGDATRLITTLCYRDKPGITNSPEVRQMFYGRKEPLFRHSIV